MSTHVISIDPPRAEQEGCTAKCELIREQIGSIYDEYGEYWCKFYKFNIRQVQGWDFKELRIKFFATGRGEQELAFDKLSGHVEDLGNGNFVIPELGWQDKYYTPFFEESWEQYSDPQQNYETTYRQITAYFEELRKGNILHGSSGEILCGAAGLPLHDL